MKFKHFSFPFSFSFSFCFSFSFFSFGQVDLYEHAMNQVGSDTSHWAFELFHEQDLPYNPKLHALIIPEYTDSAEYYFSVKTHVVIEEKSTHRVIAHNFLMHDADAITIWGYQLDSATYELASGKVAFGLKTIYHGFSHANPFDSTALDLFIVDGNRLNHVLSTSSDVYYGEWDTNCDGNFFMRKDELNVRPEKTNGYFNLQLIQHGEVIVQYSTEQGDCEDMTESVTTQVSEFYFNGETYTP